MGQYQQHSAQEVLRMFQPEKIHLHGFLLCGGPTAPRLSDPRLPNIRVVSPLEGKTAMGSAYVPAIRCEDNYIPLVADLTN